MRKYTVFLFVFACLLLSGCQSLNPFNDKTSNDIKTHNNSRYGEYYLWLKSLSQTQLLAEIKQQKQSVSDGFISAKINLLLLSSLPNSPVYNVYTAKSLLNELQKKSLLQPLSLSDQALLLVLKDQLNAQLFLYRDLEKNSQTIQQNNAQLAVQMQKQQLSVLQLNKKVNLLQKQINQLKNIEKTINEHNEKK